MLGNYDSDYFSTGFYSAGYFDSWNLNTKDLNQERKNLIKVQRDTLLDSDAASTGNKLFEFLFKPPVGILNCLKPLPPNFEVKLTLDRCVSDIALIALETGTENPRAGKSLTIVNPYLRSRYFSSPYLRKYAEASKLSDLTFTYDEVSVVQKNLPNGEKSIRIPNIIGGQTPEFIFAGILPTKALQGDPELSLTKFGQLNIEEFEFTINGQAVNGFPVASEYGSPLQVIDFN